jgi:ubiquitin-conjugating enzyme E2 variant
MGAGVDRIRPFFVEASPTETWLMRISVAANLAVIAFCAGYLVTQFASSGISWPYALLALLIGYFLADFASGLVHWGMDTWFSEQVFGRAVAIAREHHTHPQHILGYGFLEHATLGSAPSAVVVGPAAIATALFPPSALTYCLMIGWFVISTCLFFGTSFHNLCHRRSKSPVIRLAQKLHLIVRPEHHWVHHRTHTIHYCVINGWANPVCDRVQAWRRLEKLIQAITGAEPRQDDLEWQQHYRETGTLANPRSRSS